MIRKIPNIALLALLFLWGLGCGGEEPVAEQSPLPKLSSSSKKEVGGNGEEKGILADIVKESAPLRAKGAKDFAVSVLRGLYRDGELRGVLDAFEWRHSRCRMGSYPCAAIETMPRRVGALVAMVPSQNLRPKGMDVKVYEKEIEATLRGLEPAPDKALPYIPGNRERLFAFNDHHGLPRYLLLERAGSTWKILAIAGASDLSGD